MGKLALKTVDKQPTLTGQIADLNARKGQLQIGVTKINESNLTHQKRLDDSEDVLVDAITTQMGDDTPKTREIVSEARVARNVVTNQYDQHSYDLKLIPAAVKKLKTQIRSLDTEKKGIERVVIADKLPNLDELKENARVTLAELSAAWCMTTTRNVYYMESVK